MEFKRSILKVNIYGENREIRFPTLREVQSFSKEEEKRDAVEVMIEFLESLGLEKAISETMEVAHLQQIIEAVSSQKKN